MPKSNLIQVGLFLAITNIFVAKSVSAHFDAGTKVRQFVLTETDNTTEVYVRTPIPLLFGDILSGAKDDYGFLVNHGTPQSPKLFLSSSRIQASRAAFAARLTNCLKWYEGLNNVASRVRAYRILPAEPELRLLSSGIGRASLREPSVKGDVAISTGYVDMLVSVAAKPETWPLRLQTGMPFVVLSEGVQIENHIVDERTGQQWSYSRQGQLMRALALPRSRTGWVVEYIYQGILHIVEGIDHVFLVIAMALGVTKGMALIRSVTAFTLGHAVTLTVGFLGYVPQATWFIPLIELTIAATIIFAVTSSLKLKQGSTLLYAAIGLLHGFGFSFVLGNVLGQDSPELVPALAAFMVGIEIGQLSIIAFVLAAFFVIKKTLPRVELYLRSAILIGLGLIAGYMVVERIPAVFST